MEGIQCDGETGGELNNHSNKPSGREEEIAFAVVAVVCCRSFVYTFGLVCWVFGCLRHNSTRKTSTDVNAKRMLHTTSGQMFIPSSRDAQNNKPPTVSRSLPIYFAAFITNSVRSSSVHLFVSRLKNKQKKVKTNKTKISFSIGMSISRVYSHYHVFFMVFYYLHKCKWWNVLNGFWLQLNRQLNVWIRLWKRWIDWVRQPFCFLKALYPLRTKRLRLTRHKESMSPFLVHLRKKWNGSKSSRPVIKNPFWRVRTQDDDVFWTHLKEKNI